MINPTRLLADLQVQVTQVEADLHAQLDVFPEVKQRLRDEHSAAFRAKRTGASVVEWIGERVTQSAVAWVLATVFVRFCEDNSLLTSSYLAGPTSTHQSDAEELHEHFMSEDASRTHRDWLFKAFRDLGSGQAGKLLFDTEHNPLYQIDISHDAAKVLIDFWRQRADEGNVTELVHNFRDTEWDTRFLGDLYEDLSASAREKYALLQTPEFVEEFILSRTLKQAIREFGYDSVRMIDPTCGSGHFVLGAFHQILAAWEENAPSVDIHDRVLAALNSVHGVDINPFAIAIARFRLFIAALKASGMSRRDAAAYEWPLNLAIGDSLIFNPDEEITGFRELASGDLASHLYSTEDLDAHSGILEEGAYHVVVGNPPYIVPGKDTPKHLYKKLYKSCYQKYQLTVPFTERFFRLAKSGDDDGKGAGYVGQITGNGFMKREFGERLIQHYLATEVDLTEVIDASGAYIPGHGTPTVIMVGRRRKANYGAQTVRTVRSVQGEPRIPESAAQGLVWRDIVQQIDTPGKSTGVWVSAENLDRKKYFSRHPWILMDGGREAVEEINTNGTRPLRSILPRDIGFASFPGQDDAFIGQQSSFARRSVSEVRPLIVGEIIRDWNCRPKEFAVTPYGADLKPLKFDETENWSQFLWPSRQSLRATDNSELDNSSSSASPWWAWYRWVPNRYQTNLAITFSSDATTHNHFHLDRGRSVFKQTAPVIKLPEWATEQEHLNVIGVLNSSTACFWLKQMCQDKPSNGVKRGIESEKWTVRYQFNGTNVQEFPLPTRYPLTRATELDTLAQQLSATSPAALTADPEKPPTAEVLAAGRDEWHRIRARMIAVQEELDWEVYGIYGLYEDLTAPVDSLPIPGLELGQRAFEIDLGRKVEAKEAQTEWFRRHNSTMISSIPDDRDWPEEYKRTVERRLEAIRNSPVIGLVERPEYKRRWLTDGWDSQQYTALREWLLARMERRELWYTMSDDGIERPRTRTIPELVDALNSDEDFIAVAALYAPGKDLSEVIPELVSDQHVPFLAALRYKESAIKKKRVVWEEVWELQRAEDAAAAAGNLEESLKIRDSIPVPPKYVTGDFVKPSYATQRGGLDVPKERFISYSRTLSNPTEFLGWGGWDHQEQALALVLAIEARLAASSWEEAGLTPYLAGLLELLPWVRQWHPDQADFYEEVVADYQRDYELTDEALRNWRPAPARRGGGRKPKKATASKKAAEEESE